MVLAMLDHSGTLRWREDEWDASRIFEVNAEIGREMIDNDK